MEGWKSVNTDPANFSAHRFLADSYSILPRHEVARVSELLQSQLLQPLNMTPIQPRLAESNLFLVSAGGPGALSFNEFNPLFNRDGVTFQTSAVAGENGTYSGEGVLAGIYKKLSVSLGGFHYQTDGWRTNADQNDNVANAFMQMEITPATSVQAEYRHRDVTRGEVELRFAPNDFRPNLHQRDDTNSERFGFRHTFSPSSTLLGSFMYQDTDRSLRDSPNPTLRLFDLKGNDQAVSGEVQHLFRSKFFSLVSGGGHFNIDSKDDIHQEIRITVPRPPPLPPLQIFSRTRQVVDRDVEHTNVYLYSTITLPKDITLTLGASGDFFDTDVPGMDSRQQFNPKFGITWNPLPDTTLRAAAFRTFKRTLITNQTLEPTQVAGFNQFFDDFNSTRAWRYGGAIDQKFNVSSGGLEYTQRDLTIPNFSPTPEIPDAEFKGMEKTGRAYLYGTPHKWVALTADYFYERFKRDKRQWFWESLDTQRVPLGINFSHPSGLNASFKATYYHQKGDYTEQGGDPTLPHHSRGGPVLAVRCRHRLSFAATVRDNHHRREKPV